MKVLIVENELYLAQSIASKLSDIGYNCEISSSINDALKKNDFDVVLLSTSINGQNFYPVIEAYKHAIVILMVSYVSNDTVSKPIMAGAKDYILKPFMIEELIRKIKHYQEFDALKKQTEFYEKYVEYIFSSVKLEHRFEDYEAPLLIICNNQKYSDAFAFKYAKENNKNIHFYSFTTPKVYAEILEIPDSHVIYVSDFHLLKKTERINFLNNVKSKNIIVSSTENVDENEINRLEIKSDTNFFDYGEILPIEDYVKYIVLNYQHKFPDTELSKKLGISRKSLWEKRKKYGIIKKKQVAAS